MKFQDVFNHPEPLTSRPSDFWPLPTCRIGLEFELENPAGNRIPGSAAYRGITKWFERMEDGSLRDNGVEFVLREPLFGQTLRDALTDYCAEVPALRLANTYRTSVHVHLDARDMEIEQVRTLLYIYAAIEKGLYEYVGPERERNNYCVPWYRARGYITPLCKSLFPLDGKLSPTIIRDTMNRAERYAGLNANSLSKYGSLEFRHLGGTWNFDRIADWIKIIMTLKIGAMNEDMPDLLSLVRSCDKERTYARLLGGYAALGNAVTESDHQLCVDTAEALVTSMQAAKESAGIRRDWGGINPMYQKAKLALKGAT